MEVCAEAKLGLELWTGPLFSEMEVCAEAKIDLEVWTNAVSSEIEVCTGARVDSEIGLEVWAGVWTGADFIASEIGLKIWTGAGNCLLDGAIESPPAWRTCSTLIYNLILSIYNKKPDLTVLDLEMRKLLLQQHLQSICLQQFFWSSYWINRIN